MAFIYDLTDTWNAGGTSFNAIKMNVTDTASAAASRLMTLQVGGAERFSVDKAGIGTFASVVRAAGGSTTAPTFSFGSDTNTGMWSPSSDTLAFSTAGSERVRVASDGNVAIGTATTADWRLRIEKADAQHLLLFNTAGNGTRINMADQSWQGEIEQNAGNLLFKAGGTTERMRITAGGDVGINTSSPGGAYGRLTVAGGIRTTDDINSKLELGRFSSGAPNSYIKLGPNSGSLRFSNAGDTADLMTLTNAGNVGIGTTNPTFTLQVNGTGYFNSNVQFFPQDGFRFTSVSAVSAMRFGSAFTGESTAEWAYSRATGATTLSQGSTGSALNERMRIDASGNVGIGTTAPGTRLQVRDAAAPSGFSSTAVRVSRDNFGADFIGYIDQGVGHGAIISTVNNGTPTERMRIASSGNVGIGTASPSEKFVVANSTTAFTVMQATNSAGYGKFGVRDSGDAYIEAPSGKSISFWNTAERMRIDASGNLLVGTTSGSAKLNLAGSADIRMTNTANTSGFDIGLLGGSSDATAYIYQRANSAMIFGTNNAERARITSGGNLLVNISTVIQGGRFGVADTSNAVCIGLYGSGTGNTTGTYLNCGDDNAINFRVFTNGNVQNANNSYGAISDIKVKDNVEDATPKLHDLMQVRVVNYNLKTQPDQKHIGVVAQELEEIFPGLVEEAADRDAEGELTGETTKSVKYSVFVPMLIKALQEANEKIDTLAARVAQLEGN